jgi:hypothetical protein
LLIHTLAFALDFSPPQTATMELDKYEAQGADGGVVDMRGLLEGDAAEDAAGDACHAQQLDGDDAGVMSLPVESGDEKEACAESSSSARTPESHEAVEGSEKAAGNCGGNNNNNEDANDESGQTEEAASDRGGKKDGVNDASGETEDAPEDANSDISSVDSWNEHEAPPLNLNYEALKHLVDHFLSGSHGACIEIIAMRRGGFHEIRVLHFEDGWSCIARFTREYESLEKTESELATIEYVRNNTTIPVPEIYFLNYNENHVVGAAFVLMERMDGGPLGDIWDYLSIEHKLDVMRQLANVTGQLSEQKFKAFGIITKDGTIGPALDDSDIDQPITDHAFSSTLEAYLFYLQDDPDHNETIRNLYQEVRVEIQSFLERNATNPLLNPPYRLEHGDYNAWNILVVQEDKTLPPKISAIIDWDWSQTVELESLYSYPGWIIDGYNGKEKYKWAENRVLRKHFVASLDQYFPRDSPERKLVKKCFREKSYLVNYFGRTFMSEHEDEKITELRVRGYLSGIRGESDEMFTHPYDRFDWEMDSGLEDLDAESENDEADGGSDEQSESDSGDGSGDESE